MTDNPAQQLIYDPTTDLMLDYVPIPTIERFHASESPIRCIVGPVGSAKTTGATWEVLYYIPWHLFNKFGIVSTRWVVVRNSYKELTDTTQKTIFEWFSWGKHWKKTESYELQYPDGPEIELLFRSCDRPQDVKKFKSLEITGYWADESIEISPEIKLMLKNRIGRYPKFTTWKKAFLKTYPKLRKLNNAQLEEEVKLNPSRYPTRFGIETTNPPDVEHETYTQFDWGKNPPPGPIPNKKPLEGHSGFWQPPRENEPNLRPGYYDDLMQDYRDHPDWIEMYVDGKPGIIAHGKLVYNSFVRKKHVALEPLIWAKGPIMCGWDNSGNVPACVVIQEPRAGHIQVLREFCGDKQNIVTFAKNVKEQLDADYPGAKITHWADPAGENTYSKSDGTFTSNALLMRDEAEINAQPSEQNLTARIESVEKQLRIQDGILIDPSCNRLTNGFLGGYCYPEIKPGVYGNDPAKNRFSHVHDALQYVVAKLALIDHDSAFNSFDINSCAA